MALLIPNSLKQGNVQQLTAKDERREIVCGPYATDIGGLAVAAVNDIIQISPGFEGPQNLRVRLAKLSVLTAAGLSATDDLVLAGQESGTELIKLSDLTAASQELNDLERADSAFPLNFRLYDGGFVIGIKRSSTTALVGSQVVRVVFSYSYDWTGRPTHKASDGTAY